MIISSRLKRSVSAALLAAVTASSIPAGLVRAQSPDRVVEQNPTISPVSVVRTSEKQAPSFILDLQAEKSFVHVGQTLNFNIYLANQAAYPGKNAVLRVPVPAHTTALSKANLSADGRYWEWAFAEIAANHSQSLQVQVRVDAAPEGAILTTASIGAAQLDLPVSARGGAIVLSETNAVVTANRNQTTQVESSDKTLSVTLGKSNISQSVTLVTGNAELPTFNQRGFAPFALQTSAKASTLDATLQINYTEAQLLALNLNIADLSLMAYDEATKTWSSIPVTIDSKTRTIVAKVMTGGSYQLSDGSSPSEAYIPSLQAWQTSLYTGGNSASYPIDVPAGPAGLKPSLDLSYNSTSPDGRAGMRPKQQASWVGRGWSLDLGSISANKISINPNTAQTVKYYSMVFNGISSDLIRSEALVGSPLERNPTHWAWRSTNENFTKVEVLDNGVSDANRGATINGQWQPRYLWRIWTKDGMLYEFTEDLWMGWNDCAVSSDLSFETYKWLLSRVVDVNGNTISYNYDRNSYTGNNLTCHPTKYGQGRVDRDAWPTSITWGGNFNGAIDRYKVVFNSSVRTNDTAYESVDNQYGGVNGVEGTPRETRQLNNIQVLSKQNTTWELVRQYNLITDYSIYSDNTITTNNVLSADTAYPKLTLKGIQRIGKDGVTALPATTFSYGPTRGTAQFVNGDWNRLTSVNNGQGGTSTFAYETIGAVMNNNLFANNRRIISKTNNDGRGNSYTTTYSYTGATYNSLGSILDNTQAAVQAYANSAVLYYNEYWDLAHPNDAWLLHKPYKEFRGHAKVTERDANGNETDHYFYQGDAGCNPTAVGNGILNDACFLQLRDREILKGKEYRTVQRQGTSSTMLREKGEFYTVEFYTYSSTPLAGLWRSFDYTNESFSVNYDPAPAGGPTATVNRTKYYYDPANQGGVQYGNVTKVEELDVSGAVYRSTTNTYTPNTSTAYIVDRLTTQVIRDGQNRLLALTENRYDGAVTTPAVGTRGLLTLVRKYNNVPLSTSTTGVTLTSSDTSYGYDAYGNQTTVTSYAQPGTRLFNGSTTTFSAAGNGSTSSTVTTTYDPTFHVFSTSVSQPTGNTNSPSLNESAGYDYRMGTLTSVTDANGNVTNAEYDVFGRMAALIKPGDSSTLPTVKAYYADSALPFRYWTETREHAGLSGVQISSQFYDGLGRKIQTKQESIDGSQNIVVDTKYDGLNQVTQESQPRYVSETSGTFGAYTTVPGSGVNWTNKTYDSLGRLLTLTTPDGAKTTKRYWQYNNLSLVDTIDPNRNRTQHRSDQFGRLVQVQELSGNCTSFAFLSDFSCTGNYTTTWASYGMTTYSYSPLDLLTTSTDTSNNIISMTYDSLGRKLTMNDPDMGAWSYNYDVDGNLISQTDAKNQTLSFEYDLLNRLTTKKQGSTTIASYSYDQFGGSYPYGKGQLTTMTDASGSTTYGYTPRGETQITAQTVDGTTYSTYNTYRADGQPNTVVYPTGEIITYSYDAAGRQNGLSSSLGEVFQNNVSYDALGQKTHEIFGNGQQTQYSYDALSKRLTSMITGDIATLQERFRRDFTYDLAGNVQTIASMDSLNANEIMRYSYDHRDRVTNACAVTSSSSSVCIGGATFNQSYSYDVLGNITTKAGVSYSYTNGKPHAVSSVGGQSYNYDNNGNMLSGGGRGYTWNIENQPTQISTSTVTETYKYDGDNARVKKTTTTGGTVKSVLYIGSIEYWSDGKVVSSYAGVAARTTTGNPSTSNRGSVIYFHTDHLGSIGAITNGSGIVIEAERYDPWGATRSGNLTSTELGYTGQRKDDGTGLLFYNARYYDAAIARFTSADSIVPSSISGEGGSADSIGRDDTQALSPLTVDFHETQFIDSLGEELRFTQDKGFWFQLKDKDKESEQAKTLWGPKNTQALNRYSYVVNNPLRYNDPSGHAPKRVSAGKSSKQISWQKLHKLIKSAMRSILDIATIVGGANMVIVGIGATIVGGAILIGSGGLLPVGWILVVAGPASVVAGIYGIQYGWESLKTNFGDFITAFKSIW